MNAKRELTDLLDVAAFDATNAARLTSEIASGLRLAGRREIADKSAEMARNAATAIRAAIEIIRADAKKESH